MTTSHHMLSPYLFHLPETIGQPFSSRPVSVEDLRLELLDSLASRAVSFNNSRIWNKIILKRNYFFSPFYHPYASFLIRTLYVKGIPGLLTRETQEKKAPQPAIAFRPNIREHVDAALATESIDFSRQGSYSLYNWELFFHAPLLIACQLSQNQRFEEAQKWFHYIFDPINGRFKSYGVAAVWQTKPFFEAAKDKKFQEERIDRLMQGINEEVEELEDQVEAWRDHPFEPHLLARMRHAAYPKAVVMKYIDNLIGLGDSLFRRDTMESINEATLYYVLAAKLLGRKPQKVTPIKDKPVMTYNELQRHKIDQFGNGAVPLLEAENLVPLTMKTRFSRFQSLPPLPFVGIYFGIPQNENLLRYWDTVADRLFKIRHGMNIEGVLRALDLFEPPIDPALLVKAKAKGMSVRDALSDLYGPTPIYRFTTMIQKALELCNEVKALGSTLLSVIEKKESETLALMRSKQEMQMLELITLIRQKEIKELEETIQGLQKSKESAAERHAYYSNIQKVSSKEQAALEFMNSAFGFQVMQNAASLVASATAPLPDVKAGSPTTIGVTVGSAQFSGVAKFVSEAYGALAAGFTSQASIASTEASHERRWDDWKLQEKLAKIEVENLDKQIAAAEIRRAVAEQELKNHAQQIKNSQEVNEYMHTKFTNEELYQWMKGQLANLYFQAYRFAYDIAKRAEKAYAYELGLTTSDFIQPGHWDSLNSGLLAGEKLVFDLKRLEMSYFENNKRDYEITKHVSLAALNGAALLELRRRGECRFSISEELLDVDFPTHIMRRIKGISLSVPCIVGPYTSINAKLSLTSHKIRRPGKDLSGDSIGTSVAISSAVNDSGLFEFNLKDERFLPFEGKGAISDWTLKLPTQAQFDYHTISDVILHLRYTAREGIRDKPQALGPKRRLFSLKHEFADVWQTLLRSTDHSFSLKLEREKFLFVDRNKTFKPSESNLVFIQETETGYTDLGFTLEGERVILSGLNRETLKDVIFIFTY